MIYLDYSATTPVDEEVIDTYSKVCKEFIGNPNSLLKNLISSLFALPFSGTLTTVIFKKSLLSESVKMPFIAKDEAFGDIFTCNVNPSLVSK